MLKNGMEIEIKSPLVNCIGVKKEKKAVIKMLHGN